jgi:hypothetical protein
LFVGEHTTDSDWSPRICVYFTGDCIPNDSECNLRDLVETINEWRNRSIKSVGQQERLMKDMSVI